MCGQCVCVYGQYMWSVYGQCVVTGVCVCRFYGRSLSDMQWMLFTPTLAMSLVLLFLLGFPTANILPVTLNTKRR